VCGREGIAHDAAPAASLQIRCPPWKDVLEPGVALLLLMGTVATDFSERRVGVMGLL